MPRPSEGGLQRGIGERPAQRAVELMRIESVAGQDLEAIQLEARVGIEPTNKGFADLGLTTWLPRPVERIPAK